MKCNIQIHTSYFLFFKIIFKIKKQRRMSAKPAMKLSIESIEKLRINSLRDKIANRIRVIPIVVIIDLLDVFFIYGMSY